MPRYILISLFALLAYTNLIEARNLDTIGADSIINGHLSSFKVYNNKGKAIGNRDTEKTIPVNTFKQDSLNLYKSNHNEKIGVEERTDTVYISKNFSELPEVIVESRKFPLLHLLAYVREYSTLTTYKDTIFLFREKIVDYMIPQYKKVNFKGWKTPRILSSRSYYRFTNQAGLDSVSDECMYHFSWSDWVGLPPMVSMPLILTSNETSTDTLHGKYSPVEIWNRVKDNINVNVNLLADTIGRKWLPSMANFLNKGVDYDKFKVNYNYKNVIGQDLNIQDLEAYSYSIESTGRGHNMFRFNRKDEPYYVSTDAEIYFIDKEYITLREAKKWDNRNFDFNEIGIFQSPEAPPLSYDVTELMARVDNIDKNEIRLNNKPDKRIGNSKGILKMSIGQKALSFIKKILKI